MVEGIKQDCEQWRGLYGGAKLGALDRSGRHASILSSPLLFVLLCSRRDLRMAAEPNAIPDVPQLSELYSINIVLPSLNQVRRTSYQVHIFELFYTIVLIS